MKMKYSIIRLFTFFIAVFVGIMINSCSDDFLDFQPIAAENSSSFYLTMGQAEQAVTAAYSTLVSRTAWDRDITFMGDVTSDDCESGGDFENEVPDFEVFNRFTHIPSSTHIDDVWGILFKGIYLSNLAMEKIPYVLEVDPNANETIINRRLAELKFLRALNYLYLTHVFGEVPLADHVLSSDEYSMSRAPLRDIFDLIEKDLTEAIPDLPERSGLSAADIGRATKGAARALLARMYLFESSYAHYYNGDARFANLNERWDEVLQYCEQVINSNEYKLIGTDGETYNTWHGPNTNGFRYIFTVEGENSQESVFEIQYINDGLDYTHTRAGSLIQWVSPRYYTNASGNQTNTPYWGLGWINPALANMFEEGDPRFKVTASQEGDSVEINGGLRFPINFGNCPTGYYQNKYVLAASQFADAQGHGWQKSPYNFKLIRYADVVLMAAEAAFMMSQNTKALDYVNLVRKRARMCGTTNVPADLPAVSFQDIVDERRREFATEGRRFFDLVRWNLASQQLSGTSTAGGNAILFESPKNDFMPIPAEEVAISSGSLVQYPGW